MTIIAIGRLVSAHQRETASLVHSCDVIHNPTHRRMAAFAVGTYRLVVHIGMTINALLPCFLKSKRLMTLTAANFAVLPLQRKRGRPMIESQGFKVNLPTGWIVTPVASQ